MSKLTNNTTGVLSTSAGISSITSGTTTIASPYLATTGVSYQSPPTLLLKDASLTYDSDHSDRKNLPA